MNQFFNRNGRPMVRYISSPIERIGGISTVVRLGLLSHYARWKRSLEDRSGYSACPPIDSSPESDYLCLHAGWRLASGKFDTVTRRLDRIETPYTSISNLQAVPGGVLFCASSPTKSTSIVRLNLATEQFEVLCRSSEIEIDAGYFSSPQAIEFPTKDNLSAYAFFYPPQNRDYTAPAHNLPPLLVISHGGPTSATSTALDLEIQYWTSRGIAVLDVNYGGSSGYGRAYRQRLNGKWGVVDVDDCVNGALYLGEHGYVDSNQLAIRGGSAGGYTTLSALTFRDVFKAGASYYGISDLEAMTRDTHKFESRYLDSLIGPLS